MILAKLKQEEPFIAECLEEMFDRAEVSPSEVDLSQREWYLNHSWTREDEEEYREWLVQKIQEHKHTTKYIAKQEAEMFLLSYGFTNQKIDKNEKLNA